MVPVQGTTYQKSVVSETCRYPRHYWAWIIFPQPLLHQTAPDQHLTPDFL